MINKSRPVRSNQDIFQNSIHLSEYGHFWLQKQQHGVGYYNNLRFIHKQMRHTQTDIVYRLSGERSGAFSSYRSRYFLQELVENKPGAKTVLDSMILLLGDCWTCVHYFLITYILIYLYAMGT